MTQGHTLERSLRLVPLVRVATQWNKAVALGHKTSLRPLPTIAVVTITSFEGPTGQNCLNHP